MSATSQALQEVQKYLDDLAAALLRVRDEQLRIDFTWTTVELEPGSVEKISDGLKIHAENIRHILKPNGEAAP
jgi:hypothetical protein